MAINVNTVYRTVLLILNKEQRGMLTPDEFNKVGTQVQLQIFEEYFNTLDLQVRKPDNVTEYGDRIKNTNHDISIFKEYGSCTFNAADGKFDLPTAQTGNYQANFTGDGSISAFPITSISADILNNSIKTVFVDGVLLSTDDYSIAGTSLVFNTIPGDGTIILLNASQTNFYKLGSIIYNGREVQQIERNELPYISSNPLIAPSTTYPVFLYESNKVQILPSTIQTRVEASYLRKPMDIRWNFTVPAGQSYYSYSALGSVDFELAETEQSKIITRILAYAGVVIKDPSIVQVATQQAQQETIKETL
jgi:hypothetical protein